VWWYTHVITALGRLRQEDHKFQASLGYIGRNCLQKMGYIGTRERSREREKQKQREKRKKEREREQRGGEGRRGIKEVM
jgi:hypothetical protein